ncbi:MAG: Gfo/Idh/MocA family oxidoreductase, partial [Rhizomicrobium sp.]
MKRRRDILEAAGLGSAALMAAMTPAHAQTERLAPQPQQAPKHRIRFGVCGISHDHIHGMIGAVQRGGGELVSYWGAEPDKLAQFAKRYPGAKMARGQDEVLQDVSLQLVMSSHIANERAGIGVRAMRAGKDFLADKPGITTLEDLALVRKTIAQTRRIYAILYSERLEVRAAVHAGELIQQGAIGKVIQTINIAPHQVIQRAGDNGGGVPRPGWFWEDVQYGGILCDIGSHQIDQFLFYTGSTEAEIVAAQVANVRHPDHPRFQDFGDMMLRGDKGLGYVRLDWFTPDGLGTWGDGRLFVLGTDGYIEIRKYTNVAVS